MMDHDMVVVMACHVVELCAGSCKILTLLSPAARGCFLLGKHCTSCPQGNAPVKPTLGCC